MEYTQMTKLEKEAEARRTKHVVTCTHRIYGYSAPSHYSLSRRPEEALAEAMRSSKLSRYTELWDFTAHAIHGGR